MRFVYDWAVIHGTYRWCWGCPKTHIELLYRRSVRTRHLEIGPGSGYFLNRLPWFIRDLRLLDLHQGPLDAASWRLRRFLPATYRHDALHPFTVKAAIDSVGMSMVLHCLPGDTIADKAVVFDHVSDVLRPGGVFFGATVLTHGVHTRGPGRWMSARLNRAGIFSNLGDDLAQLHEELGKRFPGPEIHVVGSVALWRAVAP